MTAEAAIPKDAAALLACLAPGEQLTFQTFDDDKARRRSQGKGKDPLAKWMHGTLGEHAAELANLNARGAGVFWMVNAGDGKGRKERNVLRVRALFVDLDGAPLEPVTAATLAPHAVVESSPNRWHAYWRVADCPLPAFTSLQKALAARFSGDQTVSDLPRVLRLPGFDHRKGKAYRAHLAALGDTPPYTIDEFQRAFGIPTHRPTQETQETQEAQETQESQETHVMGGRGEKSEISIERFVPSTVGQRNRRLFALARHVKARNPDATRAELRAIVAQWHALASPAIGTPDFTVSWGDFMRGWEKVRFVEGAMMDELLQGLDADPLPNGLPTDYGIQALRLVRICVRLQRHAGNAAFFLGARKAGELLDVHYTSAANMLHALVADRLLEEVSCGTLKDRQASEYRMPSAIRANREATNSPSGTPPTVRAR